MGHTFRGQREILGLERCVRLEADDVTTVAQVKERAFAGADRAAFQAVLLETYGAEVFAIAAVLPLELDRSVGLTFEVDFAEQMSAILTLDGTLARREESSFVFRAKYSHFRSSLQRRVTVQVVLGTKHGIGVGGLTD